MNNKTSNTSRKAEAIPEVPRAVDDPLRSVFLSAFFGIVEALNERYGDVENSLIMCATGFGRVTGKPVDISTISTLSGLSRATVRRRVEKLVEQGYLQQHSLPSRTVIYATPSEVQTNIELNKRLFQTLVSAGKKAEEELAKLEETTGQPYSAMGSIPTVSNALDGAENSSAETQSNPAKSSEDEASR